MDRVSSTLPSGLPFGVPPSSKIVKDIDPSADPLARTPPRQHSPFSHNPNPFSTSPTASSFGNGNNTTRSRRKSSSASANYIRSPPLIPPMEDSEGLPSSRRGSAWTDDGHAIEETDEHRPVPLDKMDRRMSREWDAAHTVPSRFQKLEGSVFATPASRDGHVDRNREKNKGFMQKVKEIGTRGRRGSVGDI